MFRHIAISVLAATGIANLYAGSVEIGQVVGGVNEGLTSAYLTNGVPCVGATLGSNGPNSIGCPNTSAQTFNSGTTPSERNYNANLFSGVSAGTPYLGYPSGGTLSGGGETFAMINDTAEPNDNYWALLNTTTPITIPMGIFGVQNVWTMLNDNWGCTLGQTSGPCTGASNTDTVVKFVFDGNSTGSDSSTLESVTFDLINGNEIRDAVECTSGGNCATLGYATSLVASNNILPTTISGPIALPGGITVATNTLYSTSYSTGATGGNYANTNGTVSLDDQEFEFGTAFASDYLVKVQVSNLNSANGISRTALSAIDVDTFSAPEPSTLVLFGAGLALIGLGRWRRVA